MLAVAAALSWPLAAAADQVELKTKDGSFTITGELLNSDGGFLTIGTSMGEVRIPVDQVVCKGAACPAESGPATEKAGTEAAATAKAAPADAGGSTDLTVGVSANLPQDLVDLLVTAYGAQDGVTVTAAGTGRGWTIENAAGKFQLRHGDPATAGLRIEVADAAGARAARQVLALDPVVVVTAPGSRPSSLSLDELSGIYSGRTRDWTALNTRGGRIVPVVPEADPAVDGVLRDDILGARALSEGVVRAADIAGFLLSTPGAIALVRGSQRRGLKATPLSGNCGLTAGVGTFAVKSGQYLLVRRIVLNADGGPLAAPVQAFVDFAATEQGQEAIGAAGPTAQSIIRASEDWVADWMASAAKLSEFAGGADAGRVLQELTDATGAASRLSVTLRYVFAVEQPDVEARGDFARLAAAILGGLYDGNEVVFIGYTDAGSAVTQGRATSSTAANRVLRDFATAHPDVLSRPNVKFSAGGFGGIAPLVCSGSAVERAVNQRVEVWIRPL